MRDEGMPRSSGFFSIRNLSRIAATVRSAGASVAASIADRDEDAGRDEVHWAGFDKLECEDDVLHQVLLLGYKSGFQVWDVEEADDVRQLVARHDGTASFLQMQRKPITSERSQDQFGDFRPLLVVAIDRSISTSSKNTDGVVSSCSGSGNNCQATGNDYLLPTSVLFYSLKTHDYAHGLKFETPVYSIRCNYRIVAVSEAAKIHCFNAATLNKEYIVPTSSTVPVCLGSGVVGCDPFALGPRWLAYSGCPVVFSNAGRVGQQILTSVADLSSSPSNGSLLAFTAKESSKQIAAGIVTLSDMGYKRLSKYYSEFIPDKNTSMKHQNASLQNNGTTKKNLSNIQDVGIVIVRDIISKSLVVQFRAHKGAISSLAFDPRGILLASASVQGHNINVFSIAPFCGNPSESDVNGTCIHLYRLQRGITKAVIQDISFSNDSQCILISSSRGTSHLFSLSPGATGGPQFCAANFKNGSYGSDLNSRPDVRWPRDSDPTKKLNHWTLSSSGSPITLTTMSRIKNGSSGWKGAVSGAAAVATGKTSPLYGVIASVFHNFKGSSFYPDSSSFKTKYYFLVFTPSGCIIQYVMHHSTYEESGTDLSRLNIVSNASSLENDSRLVVEALQKWDVCHKWNRRDRGYNIDEYGENGNGGSAKLLQKGTKKGTSIYAANCVSNIAMKLHSEENHHTYVSEVELQLPASQVPLWAKSKIHFQEMVYENIKGNTSPLDGEVEIEKIPTHTIEARTKVLVPVCDYFQTPRSEQERETVDDKNRNGLLMQQKFGLSEDASHLVRSSCSCLECFSKSDAAAEICKYGHGEQTPARVCK